MSLKHVAQQTLQILEAGTYAGPEGPVDIAAAQKAAVAGTRLYTPEQLESLSAPSSGDLPALVVDDATSQVATASRAPDVAVLNFASARNHGGGFINGARAQEEDLCRCGGLYPCLLVDRVQAYYTVNRRHPDTLYSDHQIWSPQVPFFRTSGRGALLADPFLADVITAPAPNAGALRSGRGRIPATFERRWKHVLAIARDQGRRTLVLGAWGCGAFQNDPFVAARAFLAVLPAFGGAFDTIVFAIPNTGKRSAANFRAFAAELG